MDDIEKRILTIIVQVLEVDSSEVETETIIGDLPEWDSIHHLQLIVEIETEYGIKFNPKELVELEDVADLISLCKEYLEKNKDKCTQ